MLSHRDPEAAAALLAQLEVSRAAYQAQRFEEAKYDPRVAVADADGYGEYDPVDLYTRLVREFHWTYHYINRLDYVLVFAFVDRLAAQKRREQDDYEDRLNQAKSPGYGGGEQVEAESMNWQHWAPAPVPYQGETARYGR